MGVDDDFRQGGDVTNTEIEPLTGDGMDDMCRIAEGMDGIVRTRGIRRRNDAEVAESFVAITTTPRVPR